MGSITCIILTKNEEKNLPGALQNAASWSDELLVVDSGSDDGTVEIAKKSGASVIYRAWDGDFAAQRNFALTGAHGDWVLYLDADERLTAGAIQKVLAIKKKVPNHHYSFRRENIAFGHHFHHGAFGPDRVVRLFPKTAVHWEGKVHEHAVCSAPLVALSESLDHYTYAAFADWWRKSDQYTTIWADDAYARGKKASYGKAASHALLGMLKVYLLQGGFLEGSMGILATLQHGVYTAMKYAKLAEKNN